MFERKNVGENGMTKLRFGIVAHTKEALKVTQSLQVTNDDNESGKDQSFLQFGPKVRIAQSMSKQPDNHRHLRHI